jgi:hypothetical protein
MSFLDRLKRLVLEPADPPVTSPIRQKDHELRNLTMKLQQASRKNEMSARDLITRIIKSGNESFDDFS